MNPPLLEYEDVALGYGEEPVLTGIRLAIRPGEVVVIAGTSGCGKSTLLKAAVGLLAPLQGTVRLFGVELAGLDDNGLTALRRRVGLLFQGGALLNALTVAENVALPLSQHSRLPPSTIERLVEMKLAMVGLQAAGGKTPAELSGGMRKRAALARAMALDPALLLCDEPSAGLDPVTAAALDRLLVDLKATLGMTLVVVTHELQSIETIADRLVMVASGGLVFDGPLVEARASVHPAVSAFLERREPAPEAQGRSMLERFTGEVRP